jgi:hypothetical protein
MVAISLFIVMDVISVSVVDIAISIAIVGLFIAVSMGVIALCIVAIAIAMVGLSMPFYLSFKKVNELTNNHCLSSVLVLS